MTELVRKQDVLDILNNEYLIPETKYNNICNLIPINIVTEEDDEKSCKNCYFIGFDEIMYPCSRCIHNFPTENKFMPK